MRKADKMIIDNAIALNKETSSFFLHRFNQEIQCVNTGPIVMSKQAAIYEEITIALTTMNYKLELLKQELENLPD